MYILSHPGTSAAVEVPLMYLKNSFLLCIKHLTYGTPYDILYTGGEKQMSNRNRKHPEKKKSDIDWKSWATRSDNGLDYRNHPTDSR